MSEAKRQRPIKSANANCASERDRSGADGDPT
jgi:hypothetical protein